ncbi:cancer-related nucleoside-triphosphatase isoform X3 [Dermochelys coriacea]|uniref:cancer-related nucleoside-triphosphatase isoform X3 n=1 Tax=Dermochelys coriacea TaxID=27794 RepID=UPI001CA916A4|nr:cancer-related nucleoside-triphosphatase isoform X3 [Dermochelys coriacea]
MGAPLRARLPLHTRFPLSPAQERKGQASAELRLPVWKGPGPAGATSITSLNQSRPATRAWAARARPRDRPVLDRGRRLPLCRPPGGERGPAGGGGAGAAAAAGRALATGSGRPWRAPGAASLQPRPRPLTMAQHVFLTGPPGIGKTTLIQKATEALKSSGVPIDGFYTEEVREHGRRIGFDVVTLSGRRGTLSRLGLEGK